jgi:hypothetical protein
MNEKKGSAEKHTEGITRGKIGTKKASIRKRSCYSLHSAAPMKRAAHRQACRPIASVASAWYSVDSNCIRCLSRILLVTPGSVRTSTDCVLSVFTDQVMRNVRGRSECQVIDCHKRNGHGTPHTRQHEKKRHRSPRHSVMLCVSCLQ